MNTQQLAVVQQEVEAALDKMLWVYKTHKLDIEAGFQVETQLKSMPNELLRNILDIADKHDMELDIRVSDDGKNLDIDMVAHENDGLLDDLPPS